MLFKKIISFLIIFFFLTVTASAEPSEEEKYRDRSDRAANFFFEKTPQHFVGDLTGLMGHLGLPLLVAGGFISGMSHAGDERVNRYFQNNNALGSSNIFFNQLGATYTLLPLSVATAGVGFWIKNEKLKLLGESFVESLLLTNLTVMTLKFSTNRQRPDGSDYSFPSAHAANSFTMAANIASIYGPWYGIPAYSVATLISLSRLDTNKHFLSDVLFGATVGTAFALGVNRFHKNK
ncbi:MAG: phosphatase PAP2 family protein, partial [bacterium]|nr:phosphatase PAP2 family protein [bacterium]